MYTDEQKKIQKMTCKVAVQKMKDLVSEGRYKRAAYIYRIWSKMDDFDSRSHTVRFNKLWAAKADCQGQGRDMRVCFDGLSVARTILVYRFGYDRYIVRGWEDTTIEKALYNERVWLAMERVKKECEQ